MTQLDEFRNFFQKNGLITKTQINGDDTGKWFVLLILNKDNKKLGFFIFDYSTETILDIS